MQANHAWGCSSKSGASTSRELRFFPTQHLWDTPGGLCPLPGPEYRNGINKLEQVKQRAPKRIRAGLLLIWGAASGLALFQPGEEKGQGLCYCLQWPSGRWWWRQQATGRHHRGGNSTWTHTRNVHHKGGEDLQQGPSELVGTFLDIMKTWLEQYDPTLRLRLLWVWGDRANLCRSLPTDTVLPSQALSGMLNVDPCNFRNSIH